MVYMRSSRWELGRKSGGDEKKVCEPPPLALWNRPSVLRPVVSRVASTSSIKHQASRHQSPTKQRRGEIEMKGAVA